MREEKEFGAAVPEQVLRGARGGEGAKEEYRERMRVREQSDYNRDVLRSMGSPLEIVLNVSLWNHWPGLSFCS